MEKHDILRCDYGFPEWVEGETEVRLTTFLPEAAVRGAREGVNGYAVATYKEIANKLKKIRISNKILNRILRNPLPCKNVSKYNYREGRYVVEAVHYLSMDIGHYGGDVTLSTSFYNNETQDEKDFIVESILGIIHREFGCIWHRRLNEGYIQFTSSKFSFDGVELSLSYTLWDTMACKVEKVKTTESISSDLGLKVGEDGRIEFDADKYIIVDGEVRRFVEKNVMNCEGDE